MSFSGRGIPACCLLLLVVGLSGCGGASYDSVSLEGAFSINGKPVEHGGITFTPLASGRGRGVYAEVKNGRYLVKGVPIGQVRVSFVAVEHTGKTIEVFGEQVPEAKIIVPPNYRAGVAIEIKGDDTTRDFELSGNQS